MLDNPLDTFWHLAYTNDRVIREKDWPIDRALPLPRWGKSENRELIFNDVSSYEAFLNLVECQLKQATNLLPYDSISNFLCFSNEYINQRNITPSLNDFLRDYSPPLIYGTYTCVGLSFNIIHRLKNIDHQFPGTSEAAHLVSCEEIIEDCEAYCSADFPPTVTCEKEHVLVCLRIRIGPRSGVLILDPGYNIADGITVMMDGQHPHRGPFTKKVRWAQSHSYSFCATNPCFVEWTITKLTDGANHRSLIYVRRPFLSALDVTERRNLLYPLKALVHRNVNGDAVAAVHLWVKHTRDAVVTLFYLDTDGVKKCMKIALSYFATKRDGLRFGCAAGELSLERMRVSYEEFLKSFCYYAQDYTVTGKLASLADILLAEDFVEQFNLINDAIVEISKDN